MKRRLLSTLLIVMVFNLYNVNALSLDNEDKALHIGLEIVNDFGDFHEKDFSISPNPATSKLNIKLNRALLVDKDLDLSVYDVLGKKVYHRTELSALETSVDVSKWNRGIYLVRVTSNDATYTKRFVKQ